MGAKEKIRVLVVDDSAIVREILKERLSQHPGIEVVGTAGDPFIARNKLEKNQVDVVTLDIEMPKMDGLTFLKYLMKSDPLPVIVVSSLTEKMNKASIEALELGAVDIVSKPGGPFSIEEMVDVLIEKILNAAAIDRSKLSRTSERIRTEPSPPKKVLARIATSNQLIVVGASTGGTQAFETLFKGFSIDYPSTLAVIHMPEKFTKTFASRLNDLVEMTVKEAENNEKILPGTIYVAPGNFHMSVTTVGSDRVIKVATGPKVFNQRPAVDILFNSVAENIGRNCIGILLTGMGRDGSRGLLNIKNSGGRTIAQDEASSIIFGMPKEAIELGAADEVLPLDQIAMRLRKYF